MIFMSWISCGLPHILPHHVYILWHDYIYILMKLSHILRHGFRIFRSELPTAKSSGLALFRSTQQYEMGLAGHAELRDTVVENHWEIAIPYEWVKMVVEWMEKSYWSTSYTDDFPYCNLWFAIFQVELQFRLRIGWYGSQVELVITRWSVELDSHWLKFRSPLMTILDMAIFSNSKHSQVTNKWSDHNKIWPLAIWKHRVCADPKAMLMTGPYHQGRKAHTWQLKKLFCTSGWAS